MKEWSGQVLYRAARWIVRSGLRVLFAVLGGVRIEAVGRVPARGRVIVAPNHLCHADPPLVGAYLPREAWFVATDELFAIKVLGAFARLLRAYPIRQDSPDRAALRFTEKLLAEGNCVVMFPEGHESEDGRLQPLQGGPIFIALRTHCPIVPVGIVGTQQIMRYRSWRIRRARTPVLLRFGDPISPEALSGGLRGRAAVEHGLVVLADAIRVLTGETALADACDGQESESLLSNRETPILPGE